MKIFEKVVYLVSFILLFASLIIRFVPSSIEDPLVLTGIAIILPYIFFGLKMAKKSRVHSVLHFLVLLSGFLCLDGNEIGFMIYLLSYSAILTYETKWISFIWGRIKN